MSTKNTPPTIFLSDNLQYRCYVTLTVEGKRFKFYNGKGIDLRCFPNRKKTLEERRQELDRLLEAVHLAWQEGKFSNKLLPANKPLLKSSTEEHLHLLPTSCIHALHRQRTEFDKQYWSTSYVRDMSRLTNELVAYLVSQDMAHLPLADITPKILTGFLSTYRSSARYYMNKRRNLSALFSRLVQDEELTTNPVPSTKTFKIKEVLNEAYTPEQLMIVLTHLAAHHENLYLCALLTYGTLLRPHREIRLLCRKHLDATLDHITLPGNMTKSGRIRRVPVPDFVRELLISREVDKMDPDASIFTGNALPPNPDYFTTAWSRQKRLMLKSGHILPNQTLYSFRHSAAIFSFTNRQDLRLLQGLMGHSTPDVTIKYLRSLGSIEVNKEDLPRLPGY